MQIDNGNPPPLDELEAAVRHAPGDRVAWLRLSDGYAAADMFEACIPILQQALRLAPRDPHSHAALGHAFRAIELPREAIPHFEEAKRLDPDADRAGRRTFDLAAALDEAGEHAAAVDLFRKALELDPRQRVAWMRLAFALNADGRFAEAIPAFEKATAYRPKSARLWAGFADAYEQTGQQAKALQAYLVSVRLGPFPPASFEWASA